MATSRFLQRLALALFICHVLCPASSQADEEFAGGGGGGDLDDLKKATLLNLLRVMGETRMLEQDVPIVFNRKSQLFQSYLVQRTRSPRRVEYSPNNLPDTLYREDTKSIHPEAKFQYFPAVRGGGNYETAAPTTRVLKGYQVQLK